jgi:hypothetical protein
MELSRKHLAQADRHIAECKAHIGQQRKLIESDAKGHSTEVAEAMLDALKETLRALAPSIDP